RALREFFLVLVQGYERAPRVSQLPIFFLYYEEIFEKAFVYFILASMNDLYKTLFPRIASGVF
ncbi:hypothetical protein, partial [Blautia wexlerae]|uniref:hypothetical protein n=1 Tax=Blautia wexlerae TaxID=418240 RepID=UPI0034A4C97F